MFKFSDVDSALVEMYRVRDSKYKIVSSLDNPMIVDEILRYYDDYFPTTKIGFDWRYSYNRRPAVDYNGIEIIEEHKGIEAAPNDIWLIGDSQFLPIHYMASFIDAMPVKTVGWTHKGSYKPVYVDTDHFDKVDYKSTIGNLEGFLHKARNEFLKLQLEPNLIRMPHDIYYEFTTWYAIKIGYFEKDHLFNIPLEVIAPVGFRGLDVPDKGLVDKTVSMIGLDDTSPEIVKNKIVRVQVVKNEDEETWKI